jgi:hypothetical protein
MTCMVMMKMTFCIWGELVHWNNFKAIHYIHTHTHIYAYIYISIYMCVHVCSYTVFLVDNAHLMYNAHPKLFRHSFWLHLICVSYVSNVYCACSFFMNLDQFWIYKARDIYIYIC